MCGTDPGEDVPAELFADIQHSNNLSWSLLNVGAGEYHTTLFLKDTYGKGQMYLLNIPENPSYLAPMSELVGDVILNPGEFYEFLIEA